MSNDDFVGVLWQSNLNRNGMRLARWFPLILASALPFQIHGQQAASQGEAAAPLRVFIDCHTFCDTEFLQTEMTFVRFVRDREAADVHVIVTSQGTGAGGQAYTLTLIGRGQFARLSDTLTYSTLATNTEDDQRRAQLRYLGLVLARYSARTSTAAYLTLRYQPPAAAAAVQTGPARDPWNAWVFRTGVDGGVEQESQQRSLEGSADLSANRVTAGWKLTNSIEAEYNENRFTVEEDSAPAFIITSYSHSINVDHLLVRSLSDHWSLGERVSVTSSTFRNDRLSVRVAPALEFNVFPYSQSTRRQLVLQYSIGLKRVRYEDTTLFDKLRETIADQQLVIGAEAIQPWGNVFSTLTAAHHLNDVGRNRLTFFGGIDIRITKGLSLDLFAEASRIRDQVNLAKEGADLTEVLLRRRQLATGYSIDFSIGMSYTFGSIFSTVVNPRMNRDGNDCC
ncbi:MAG TPA: hypothetical protein VJ717_18715 [Gemmatimonadaceae bacterium]|nr:hypothetical protein [Gemmatimonadaceae bacterium]